MKSSIWSNKPFNSHFQDDSEGEEGASSEDDSDADDDDDEAMDEDDSEMLPIEKASAKLDKRRLKMEKMAKAEMKLNMQDKEIFTLPSGKSTGF